MAAPEASGGGQVPRKERARSRSPDARSSKRSLCSGSLPRTLPGATFPVTRTTRVPNSATAPSGPLQVQHTAGVTAGAGLSLPPGAHSHWAVSQDESRKKGGGRRKPKSHVTGAAPRQALPAP